MEDGVEVITAFGPLNRKKRRQYAREGATPAKEPFTISVGKMLELIREDGGWNPRLVECLAKIDPEREVKCVYDMPDGGAVLVVERE